MAGTSKETVERRGRRLAEFQEAAMRFYVVSFHYTRFQPDTDARREAELAQMLAVSEAEFLRAGGLVCSSPLTQRQMLADARQMAKAEDAKGASREAARAAGGVA